MAGKRDQHYEHKQDQPCMAKCELSSLSQRISIAYCELPKDHPGPHRTDLTDTAGSSITITWRKRRG